MDVSIVIPCYNAESTVSETLESVIAQTFKNWEAIIVDDGSTDNTLGVIDKYLKNDNRIKLIRQKKGGVSAARNKGLENSANNYILFLDADDIILPEYLEVMTKALIQEPEYDAAYCAWKRMVPGGELIRGGEATVSGDIFHLFINDCLFAIHSCLIKRELLNNAGGFDTSLTTCEDWDLWQRIARTGAKFKAINKPLAIYRMRPFSASMNPERMIADAYRVMTRGYSADPRVKDPYPLHASGYKSNNVVKHKYNILCWTAGLSIGAGKNPQNLLYYLKDEVSPDLDPTSVAYTLIESSILPACKTHKQWNELWLDYKNLYEDFLTMLELQSRSRGLKKKVLLMLERHFIKNAALKKENTEGSIFSASIEITEPVKDINTPLNIERLIADIYMDKKFIGKIELPVFNGYVPSLVLKDSIANELAWDILGEFFSKKIYKRKKIIWKLELLYKIKKEKVFYDEKDWRRIHKNIGWSVFLQEIWQKKFWPEKLFYAPPLFFNRLKNKKILKDDWIILELTGKIPNIKLKGKEPVILFTAGGEPVDLIKINKKNGTIYSNEIISHITLKLGTELCFTIVREIIIGHPLNKNLSVFKRLKKLAKKNINSHPVKCYINKIHNSFKKTRALVIGRYDYSESGLSSYRYASFPSDVKELFSGITELSSISISTNGRSEKNILYAPGLILKKNYQNFKGVSSDIPVSKGFMKGKEIPILMYHRVSPAGSDKISRYRITPQEFEEHLIYLKEAGYYSIDLNQWGKFSKENKFIFGKPVILTFDDGYKDFIEYAYPLLKKYGFSAIVFIVTGNVAKTNSWDEAYGETIQLMDWDDITELHNNGISFGAHSHTHPPLTALSPVEIVTEALQSKNILQQKLNSYIDAFAYPYGDFDIVVKKIIGSCGFNFGLTCEERIAKYDDHFLALPRIEVIGESPVDEFIKKLNTLPAQVL